MAKKIKLDSKNYRKHSTENQEMINKSLRELGAGRSVLMDNEDELIAGNETYTQAQKLGLPIKIVESDGKTLIVVKRTDLATEDDARKQLAIVDNLASDKSEFDFELLKDDFEIDFLQDVGFDDKIKRAKEQLKDLEILIDEGSASSRQKQDYIVLKAKVEEREDLLALVEGMTE